jgi:hypothetical protein
MRVSLDCQFLIALSVFSNIVSVYWPYEVCKPSGNICIRLVKKCKKRKKNKTEALSNN